MFAWDKLRKARIEAGLGVPELAKMAGVSDETIYRYERGNGARPITARKIIDALNQEVKDFLADDALTKGA